MEGHAVSHDVGTFSQTQTQAHHNPSRSDEASLRMDALCLLTLSADPAVQNSAYAQLSAMLSIPPGYPPSGSSANTVLAEPPAPATTSNASTNPMLATLSSTADFFPVATSMRMKWSRADLDGEDIQSRGGGATVTCRWRDCEYQGERESLFRMHIAGESGHAHDLRNINAEGKIKCRWQGCHSPPMMPSSMDRHVRNIHLNMMSFTCSRCNKCSRADSYLKDHGPARYCRREPVTGYTPPGVGFDLASLSGPSYTAPSAGPASLFQSGVGPVRTRGVHNRRAGIQHSVAYPPPAMRPQPYPRLQGGQPSVLADTQLVQTGMPTLMMGAQPEPFLDTFQDACLTASSAGLPMHAPTPVRAYGPDFLPRKRPLPIHRRILAQTITAPKAVPKIDAAALWASGSDLSAPAGPAEVQNALAVGNLQPDNCFAVGNNQPDNAFAMGNLQPDNAFAMGNLQPDNAWMNDENVPPPLFF
ncbi:hypothetical protein C8Q78DRAFT_1083054 [Trametes maxima]|nr:hypothetical protein C8Q78DRAFT_1083054 [Trametes maxima]